MDAVIGAFVEGKLYKFGLEMSLVNFRDKPRRNKLKFKDGKRKRSSMKLRSIFFPSNDSLTDQ